MLPRGWLIACGLWTAQEPHGRGTTGTAITCDPSHSLDSECRPCASTWSVVLVPRLGALSWCLNLYHFERAGAQPWLVRTKRSAHPRICSMESRRPLQMARRDQASPDCEQHRPRLSSSTSVRGHSVELTQCSTASVRGAPTTAHVMSSRVDSKSSCQLAGEIMSPRRGTASTSRRRLRAWLRIDKRRELEVATAMAAKH